ncbi:cytochrome P450 [Pseudomassariella vexata]|uniref:Cytochrome P450 n=1 Tax=Pseudomassariella vexata TaxID=1141098 RepID=A0A1Y2EK59_9PEZI|nr:cytochrome P450 [Pseudomassariella vexata]ORY71931.1 cytochrome P450 [Pseudomassariella vexata]
MHQAWLSLSFSVLTIIIWKISKIGRRPKNYPPGPPTLPLIGNLHQMPRQCSLAVPKEGTKVWIYLLAYSGDESRHCSIVGSGCQGAQDVLSGSLRPLLMRYGETSRMVRKLAHSLLNVRVARTYVPYQDLEVRAMLVGFLEKPDNFANHIRHYTTYLTTQMTFGYRTPTSDDPNLLEMFDAAAIFDVFPVIRRLPDFLLPIKMIGREIHKRERKLFMGHYLNARSQLNEGTSKPCCCIDLLRLQKAEDFSDDVACYMSGSLLQAGSETTSAILIGFVQAMVLFPEVSKEAQAEIDRVCGDRLPDLNDFPNLPYTRGCIKESLRWMSTVILGVPHAVTQDYSYLGYKIPKDASVD